MNLKLLFNIVNSIGMESNIDKKTSKEEIKDFIKEVSEEIFPSNFSTNPQDNKKNIERFIRQFYYESSLFKFESQYNMFRIDGDESQIKERNNKQKGNGWISSFFLCDLFNKLSNVKENISNSDVLQDFSKSIINNGINFEDINFYFKEALEDFFKEHVFPYSVLKEIKETLVFFKGTIFFNTIADLLREGRYELKKEGGFYEFKSFLEILFFLSSKSSEEMNLFIMMLARLESKNVPQLYLERPVNLDFHYALFNKLKKKDWKDSSCFWYIPVLKLVFMGLTNKSKAQLEDFFKKYNIGGDFRSIPNKKKWNISLIEFKKGVDISSNPLSLKKEQKGEQGLEDKEFKELIFYICCEKKVIELDSLNRPLLSKYERSLNSYPADAQIKIDSNFYSFIPSTE